MNDFVFDENIYDTIRKNIRRYRKARKITSAELAEKTGLSHDFIRQIQSDKARYNFSVETFYKISVVLGVSMDSLARREGDDSEQIAANNRKNIGDTRD